jgi:hypothetical protein
MVWKNPIIFATLAFLATGCGAAHYSPGTDGLDPPMARTAAPGPEGGAPTAGISHRNRLAGEIGPSAPEIMRKVIYTAQFTVDVYDIPVAQKGLRDFIEANGGHLQHLAGNVMVVRLPTDRFSEVEGLLKTLGRVDDRLTDIRAEDITEAYYDAQLRLKSKKRYLDSLYVLLDEAGKLTDKLAVQQEIARVVEEIEQLEGRLRLLSNQVSLATVTVTWRLAHSGSKRTFTLPWEWLDTLGVENLTR